MIDTSIFSSFSSISFDCKVVVLLVLCVVLTTYVTRRLVSARRSKALRTDRRTNGRTHPLTVLAIKNKMKDIESSQRFSLFSLIDKRVKGYGKRSQIFLETAAAAAAAALCPKKRRTIGCFVLVDIADFNNVFFRN